MQTGAQAIGSAMYGSSNPKCPIGSFYDMSVGSVPTCKACIGFSYNLDPALQCYPPLQSSTQKFFCGEHPTTSCCCTSTFYISAAPSPRQ